MAVPLQELCESSQEAKELFDKAADILGYDLLSLCVEGTSSGSLSTFYSELLPLLVLSTPI
jgi:hypothetical protein